MTLITLNVYHTVHCAEVVARWGWRSKVGKHSCLKPSYHGCELQGCNHSPSSTAEGLGLMKHMAITLVRNVQHRVEDANMKH